MEGGDGWGIGRGAERGKDTTVPLQGGGSSQTKNRRKEGI